MQKRLIAVLRRNQRWKDWLLRFRCGLEEETICHALIIYTNELAMAFGKECFKRSKTISGMSGVDRSHRPILLRWIIWGALMMIMRTTVWKGRVFLSYVFVVGDDDNKLIGVMIIGYGIPSRLASSSSSMTDEGTDNIVHTAQLWWWDICFHKLVNERYLPAFCIDFYDVI